MSQPIKILGSAGSLRKASYNRGALRAAQQVAAPDATIEIFELDEIPLFSQDKERPLPDSVAQFKAGIRAADAILICTPEYNYSIPGVLKNALDWASRPYGDNAWDGKPVAIMGASPGMLGTARAQYHLRQCFVFLNLCPLCRPEVMIADAGDKFDDNGNLVDQDTRDRIKKLVDALVVWTRQLQKGRQ